MSKWAYSLSEDEGWDLADSRDDALELGLDSARDCGAEEFYISSITEHEMETPSGDWLIEQLMELNVYQNDNAPECSEHWLTDLEKTKVEALELEVKKGIFDWAKKYNVIPNWFLIDKCEVILVTKDGECDEQGE
jgi:hypothetical protein